MMVKVLQLRLYRLTCYFVYVMLSVIVFQLSCIISFAYYCQILQMLYYCQPFYNPIHERFICLVPSPMPVWKLVPFSWTGLFSYELKYVWL